MDRTDRIIEIATRLLAAQFGTTNEVTVTHAVDSALKLERAVRERVSKDTYGTTNLSDTL